MQQIKKNFISNILFLLTSVIVVLYFTPYLINSLGLVAYGIIPLTLLINQYITIFTGSLTSALSRFLSISIQRKRFREASKYLSSAILMILCIVLLFTPLLYFFIKHIDRLFTIPTGLIYEAQILFGLTLGSFFISLFTAVFNISQYAANRIDILNGIKSLRNVFKFIFTVLCFIVWEPNLIYIGTVNLFVECVLLILSIYFFFKETHGKVYIKFNLFRSNFLFAMLAMTIWSILHQFGDTFIYQMDVYFVNKYFNSSLSGIVGTFINLGSYVIMVVYVVSGLFGPYILLSYSRKEHSKLINLTLNTSSLVGILSAILVGVFIGFVEQFILLWVGESFVEYTLWFIIKLSWMPLYAAAGLFAYVYRAHNKVKFPAIVTLLLGGVNISIQYFFYTKFSYLGENIINYGLIVSGLFALFQSYILNAYYFNKLYPNNSKYLIKNLILIVLIILFSSILSRALSLLYYVPSLFFLLCYMGIVIMIFCSIAYFVILNKEQKQMIKEILF